MTNPFQPIIEQADTITAEFSRIEADARAEYDEVTEKAHKKNVRNKDTAQTFLKTFIQDADGHVVENIYVELQQQPHLHKQVEKAARTDLAPSTDAPRWALNTDAQNQIEQDVVAARQAVYDALFRFRNAELRQKFVRRFAAVFAVISVIGAGLLNHHLQELQRQQEYVAEIQGILGDSEIIATDGYRSVFRLTPENILSWLREPAVDDQKCDYVLPSNKQNFVYCSDGGIWSALDLRSGNMQKQVGPRPSNTWKFYEISTDGQSFAYSRIDNYPVLHRSGKDATFDIWLIDFAFSPDNTQYAYTTENTIFWYKDDALLGTYPCDEFCLVRFSWDSKQLIQYNRKKLVFMSYGDGKIEVNQSIELQTRYDSKGGIWFAVSLDNRFILYFNHSNELFFLDLKTNRQVKLNTKGLLFHFTSFIWIPRNK